MSVALFITGGRGLLGSHIVEKFKSSDCKFFAPTRSQLDLKNTSETLEFMKSNEITDVIHCAAKVGGIADNIDNPGDFILDNLLIDSSILSAARKLGVKKFLYFGSSCMYPPLAFQPFKEKELMSGPLEVTNQSYAIAKIAGSSAVASIAKQDSLTWRTLILSNIYGPGDNFKKDSSHLVAAVIAKLYRAQVAKQSNVRIWGDGKSRREFTYVGDVANFVYQNWKNFDHLPTSMNLGSGIDYSVKEYYERISKILNYNPTLDFDQEKPNGMRQKLMDSSLARTHGWNPSTDLESGLRATIDWYSQNAT